ncbi:hypothetical protein [Marinobacterium jannaschii]|uniref:hypothetical protein n=1 Tax=Marinobacterium jannaschii TaxID=64970 RepID=UPI000A9C78C1|nr:hypothetical protein [Marinobacterium jannaschii]
MRTLMLCLCLLLGGCATSGESGFSIKSLAKSDIDSVTDSHRRQLKAHLQQLTIKLYKRNPRELIKVERMSIRKRLDMLYVLDRKPGQFAELSFRDGNDAIRLAFSEEYKGDRVFALMAGLSTMLNSAYQHKPEFFMLDDLDQQKLYNSARNLETVAWQLRQRRDSRGQLFLLSNGVSDSGVANYSFELLFGKMISLQDMMAIVISEKTNRTITHIVHRAASMTLLPI